MKSSTVLVALVGLALAVPGGAQPVVQARGVDSRVDYAALTQIGPWDDRNYQLTVDDLALLAPNELEQRDPIPAFFRVWLRRHNPELRRSGPGQYPRSAYNAFLHYHGGYQVDGRLYRGVSVENGRFAVKLQGGAPVRDWEQSGRDPDVVSGEVRVTTPNDAAESAIAINPVNSNQVIAGSNGPGSGQRMHFSTNGGSTWTQVTLPLGSTCCDPAVDWSSDGTKAYAATLGISGGCCGVWIYRSGDGGATWSDLGADPRRELTTNTSDKEYIHVDTFATSPFKDNLYVTWHDGNVMKFARSTDQAQTFGATITISGGGQQGIGSDITTDKNGNVYYFWPAFNTKQMLMKKSTDGGATFPNPAVVVATTADAFDFAIPVMEARRVFMYNAADVDYSNGPFANSIYVSWTDNTVSEQGTPANNHARIQVAYSRDGGATWTVRTPHPTADQNTVDRFHQWLEVTDDGAIHLIYYDTNLSASRQAADIYHSVSTDGGDTWTQQRLTTASSPNIADGFEWGDYNGLSAVGNDLLAIYTDNRDENGGAAESVDVYAIGFQGSPPIFVDGFETGDTSGWATQVP
jgi:hypothetical protein